jgi:hypothetical protein
MERNAPIQYVGPPELRSGHVVGVERGGDRARVRVQTADGRELTLEFNGVAALTAVHPEGMLLYGLAELPAEAPLRQFLFANWEEWDDAGLEIAAREFTVALKPERDRPAETP